MRQADEKENAILTIQSDLLSFRGELAKQTCNHAYLWANKWNNCYMQGLEFEPVAFQIKSPLYLTYIFNTILLFS